MSSAAYGSRKGRLLPNSSSHSRTVGGAFRRADCSLASVGADVGANRLRDENPRQIKRARRRSCPPCEISVTTIAVLWQRTTFGTWGSQVQILPLRPTLSRNHKIHRHRLRHRFADSCSIWLLLVMFLPWAPSRRTRNGSAHPGKASAPSLRPSPTGTRSSVMERRAITSKLPTRANFSSPDERHNLRDRASVPVAG